MNEFPPQMIETAEKLLADAMEDLKKGGDFIPKAFLLGEEKTVFMVIDGNIMNSRDEKSELARRIKAQCREIHAYGTIFLSDIWYASMTEEQHRRRKLVEQMLGQQLDVVQCAEAGLCQKKEAIMLVMQTKSAHKIIHQIYRRGGKKGTDIEFESRFESQDGKLTGKMANWLESE